MVCYSIYIDIILRELGSFVWGLDILVYFRTWTVLSLVITLCLFCHNAGWLLHTRILSCGGYAFFQVHKILKWIHLTFGYGRGCALGRKCANWASALDVVHPEGKGKGKGKGSNCVDLCMAEFMHESIVFCSACTMSSSRKFTFAISSSDEFLVLVLLLLLPSLLGNFAYVKKNYRVFFAQLAPKKRNLERFMRGTWLTVYYITLTLFKAKFYKYFR